MNIPKNCPAGVKHPARLAAIASLMMVSVAYAQTPIDSASNPNPVPPPTPSAEEELVVLSPFEVNVSQDKGYRATNTLAGSRINTALRDVPASITVITKEFMNDVAAVGINDIISYTANGEGTRDYTNSTSSLGRPYDGISNSPNTSNRVRGLFAADITRDYFYTIGTSVGFDSYNLDQVTINRGPNSVLAGLGSPAGIINYAPQTASVLKNKNEISYRFGSYGDKRATFNSNIVALKNVLGFRVAGVWSDVGYKQQPAYNKDKRIYAAVTYKPFDKTKIQAGFEYAKIKANNPNSITPEDDVTQWVNLGKPSYDVTAPGSVSSYLYSDWNNNPTIVFNRNGGIEGTYNFGQTVQGGAPAGYLFQQQNLDNVGLWTSPIRMNSNRYLPLDKLNLQPSTANNRLRTFNVSIDQEIVHGLNANVAYLHEAFDAQRLDFFRSEYANYMIDVNKKLPNGAVNPHYGETFMQFRGLDNLQTDDNTNDVYRGTLTYELNLTKTNKWLGRWNFTGFLEKRKTETDHLQYTARARNGVYADTEVVYRYYLGGTENTPATTVPRGLGLFSNLNNLYYNSSAGTWQSATMDTYYVRKSDAKQLTKQSDRALVIQSYLWDDRIVGMFGVRRDKNQVGFSNTIEWQNPGVLAAGIAPDDFGELSTYSQTTKTYGVVVHPVKWLSLHYNHSENFVPATGAVDLLGKHTPAPTGEGKDYGVAVDLLGNKLNIKLNWFDLTAADSPAGNANFPLAQWVLPFLELKAMPEIAQKAGIQYKQAMAPGLELGDSKLANAYTSDNVSKGLELEMTYNVNDNWRIMASVSKQEAKQTTIAPQLTAFIEERLAYWKSVPQLWNGPTGGSYWGVAWTGQQIWQNWAQSNYLAYKSVDGQPSQQLAKWHASLLTNYTFKQGPLKGVNFGGGARYIDKKIIGNPAIRNAAGEVIALDLAHPYYTGAYIAVDAWIGYATNVSILDKKYNLSFQLNGRDLEQSGGFRPIVANSDGTHSVYRIVQPRTFYLTTKLEF